VSAIASTEPDAANSADRAAVMGALETCRREVTPPAMSPPAIPSAFAVASLPLPSVTARTPTSPELTTVDESMEAR
jgi:hypothetical protein